jgi:hypothetical protein
VHRASDAKVISACDQKDRREIPIPGSKPLSGCRRRSVSVHARVCKKSEKHTIQIQNKEDLKRKRSAEYNQTVGKGPTTGGISAKKASANQIMHYKRTQYPVKVECKSFRISPVGKAISIHQSNVCAPAAEVQLTWSRGVLRRPRERRGHWGGLCVYVGLRRYQ